MKPWEGEQPTEQPPVGTVLVATCTVGRSGRQRRVCLVTDSGVQEWHDPERGTVRYPWARGRWQRRDGGWSEPTRFLCQPWEAHQLDVLEHTPVAP